jgi:hypothetical protein
MDLDKGLPNSRLHLAYCYFCNEEYEECLVYCEKALEILAGFEEFQCRSRFFHSRFLLHRVSCSTLSGNVNPVFKLCVKSCFYIKIPEIPCPACSQS